MRTEETKAKAKVLKALAHPLRVGIVETLSRGDRCVAELHRRADVSQPTLSRHLARLKNAGIVSEHPRGVRVMHRLEMRCVLDILNGATTVLKSDASRRGRVAARL